MWGIVEKIKSALKRRAEAMRAKEEARRSEIREVLVKRPGISGRELRKELQERGVKYGVTSFYFKMAQLEDEGIIEAWSVTMHISDGSQLHPIKERRYKWKETSSDNPS